MTGSLHRPDLAGEIRSLKQRVSDLERVRRRTPQISAPEPTPPPPAGGGVMPAFRTARSSFTYANLDDAVTGWKWLSWDDIRVPAVGGVAGADHGAWGSPQTMRVETPGWYQFAVHVSAHTVAPGASGLLVNGPQSFRPADAGASGVGGGLNGRSPGPGAPVGAQFELTAGFSCLVIAESPSYFGVMIQVPNAASVAPFIDASMTAHFVCGPDELVEP